MTGWLAITLGVPGVRSRLVADLTLDEQYLHFGYQSVVIATPQEKASLLAIVVAGTARR